jgi:hypothetical protein
MLRHDLKNGGKLRDRTPLAHHRDERTIFFRKAHLVFRIESRQPHESSAPIFHVCHSFHGLRIDAPSGSIQHHTTKHRNPTELRHHDLRPRRRRGVMILGHESSHARCPRLTPKLEVRESAWNGDRCAVAMNIHDAGERDGFSGYSAARGGHECGNENGAGEPLVNPAMHMKSGNARAAATAIRRARCQTGHRSELVVHRETGFPSSFRCELRRPSRPAARPRFSGWQCR